MGALAGEIKQIQLCTPITHVLHSEMLRRVEKKAPAEWPLMVPYATVAWERWTFCRNAKPRIIVE